MTATLVDWRRIAFLWGLGVLLQAPVFALSTAPVQGFWQAVGYGLIGAAIGAAFLYARRPRAATVAVVVWAALAWANAFS